MEAVREDPVQGGTHLTLKSCPTPSVGTVAVADVSMSRVVVLIAACVVGVY